MKFKSVKLLLVALFGITLLSSNSIDSKAIGFNPVFHDNESYLPGFNPVLAYVNEPIVLDNEQDINYTVIVEEINYDLKETEDNIEDKIKEITIKAEVVDVQNTYSGTVLTKQYGTVKGPSGVETYYNLDMSKVVANTNGQYGEYWVRSDGCKMLGDYIMVAADLSIRPRGSLVETSLGIGIVVDTGDFIYTNPYQLDIATTW